MTDVFISYTREDRPRCAVIAEKLKALGLDVWYDARLASGVAFDSEIEQHVYAAKAVLVLWSPGSTKSQWVRNEAAVGQKREVVVSVEITPSTLPVNFTNTHTEFLHTNNFADDDPAWVNILARLANLTGHPNLAQYRDLEPQATRRRMRFPIVPVAMALLVIVGAGAVYASGVWRGAAPTAEQTVETAIDPDIETFVNMLRGQWALSRADCPGHTPGTPVDMTPSVGPWFTVDIAADSLTTSSAGRSVPERIVGLQNGWLRTFANNQDQFYRLDESGRLLLRVGAEGEAIRLEPCI